MTVLPNRSSGDDLPSSSSSDDRAAVGVRPENNASSPSRYVLPKDLDAAIKQLNDQELDSLISAALKERSRRKKPSSHHNHKQRQDAHASVKSLPQGKLNAVRAAFKAGVSPARIAREFGIPKADVHSALRDNAVKGR